MAPAHVAVWRPRGVQAARQSVQTANLASTKQCLRPAPVPTSLQEVRGLGLICGIQLDTVSHGPPAPPALLDRLPACCLALRQRQVQPQAAGTLPLAAPCRVARLACPGLLPLDNRPAHCHSVPAPP